MKKIPMLLMLLLFTTLCSLPAFAHNKENMTEHIQVMRQAADELKSSHPDLSKKLNDFADQKEKWRDEKSGDWKDRMSQMKTDVQKIRSAHEFLQGKNDDLAKDLKEIADRWDQKIQEKEKRM